MTIGTIMFVIGIIGAVGCLIGFIATWKIFATQRKKMLEFLEQL